MLMRRLFSLDIKFQTSDALAPIRAYLFVILPLLLDLDF